MGELHIWRAPLHNSQSRGENNSRLASFLRLTRLLELATKQLGELRRRLDLRRERLAELTLVRVLSIMPLIDSAAHAERDDVSRDDRAHESTFLIHEKLRLACGGSDLFHSPDDADTTRK